MGSGGRAASGEESEMLRRIRTSCRGSIEPYPVGVRPSFREYIERSSISSLLEGECWPLPNPLLPSPSLDPTPFPLAPATSGDTRQIREGFSKSLLLAGGSLQRLDRGGRRAYRSCCGSTSMTRS